MNKLSIFWNERRDEHFYWCLEQPIESTGLQSPIHPPESQRLLKADLASLADLAKGKLVELILSSADLHINQVSLPHKAQRHLRKAVPYLLEEQFAESVDEVFIAVGERSKAGEIPVRAINLDYFEQLLRQFKNAEIKLAQVRVDLDLLATPAEGYQLALLDGCVLVSEADGQRWSCEADDFSWLIQKRLEQHSDSDDLPVAIPMLVMAEERDTYQLFENQLPVGRFAPKLQLLDSLKQALAASRQPLFSLLQGEFEVKAENTAVKQLLLKVACLGALILFAHLAYQGSLWYSLQQQKAELGKQRTALWKQAFPGRKVPANPDKVLRSQLRSLSGGQGESSFLSLLDSTSQSINNLAQIYPTNISFDAARNELRMDLIAKDLATLNQYRDALKQAGHRVEMSSATQRGEGYSSRLVINK